MIYLKEMCSVEILYIIVGIIILIIWYICSLNKLTRARIKVMEALSGIDVALTKRHDVLINMIETVKGYVKHESKIMFATVEIRKDMQLSEKFKANRIMDKNLENINIIAEEYPKLKASENFNRLQRAIVDVEEHLQASRRCYNSNVSNYNQLILSFPTNIVAKIKNMKEESFFETEEDKKDNIQVNL